MRLTKPLPGAQINWGHPLARGLMALMPFSEGAGDPFDLVAGRSTAPENGPGWTTNAMGRAGLATDISQNWTALKTDVGITNAFTACLIRRKTDATLRAAGLLGIGGGGSGSYLQVIAPYIDGSVYFDYGGGAASPPNRLTYVWNSTTNIERFVFVAGTRGSAIYVNGVLKASQGTAISRTITGGSFFLNKVSIAGVGDLQEFSQLAILNVEWTAAQVQEWTVNPYVFFAPPSPARFYAFMAQAAAGSGVVPRLRAPSTHPGKPGLSWLRASRRYLDAAAAASGVGITPITGADAVALALLETAQAQAVLILADTLGLTLADAAALAVQVIGADLPSLGLVEVAGLVAQLTSADSVSLTVSEGATPALLIQIGDTVTLLLTESATAAPVSGTVPIAGTDLVALLVTETVAIGQTVLVLDTVQALLGETVGLQATLLLTDATVLTLAEQTGLLATLQTAEALPLALTEASGLLALLQGSDLLTALLTEGAAALVLQAPADTLLLGLGEAQDVRAALLVGDTLTPALVEALGPLLASLGVQDSAVLTLDDPTRVLNALATLDTLTVVIGDTGLILTVGQLGEVLVATVTSLMTARTVVSLLPRYTVGMG